ncbi:MAG: xanthine dehydrogenase family protein molybdopterin-binding subunit [Sandarakinorhabdus sp.]|nr:xanthine dehydrogenase family protein molybdopterin-binding subunit [Sandarakinorhabdus sp.]
MHRPGDAIAAAALTRRGFLVAAGASGLAFGFTGTAMAAGGAYEPTLWYSIAPDGIVTVNIIRAEMGQHVGTALARILADELEADWANIRIAHVDSDPKWGTMVTGGSWSVWQSFPLYSRAGAAGRIALTEAGAKLLGVASSACTARGGRVSAGGKSVSYAEIVKAGVTRSFTAAEIEALPVKPVAERRLVGKPVTALDIDEKTNGTALYGIDAAVPGMLHARPVLPPTRYGAKVVAVDDSAARGIKGYLQSIVLDDPSGTVPGWVMVIATGTSAAIRAADRVKVTWAGGDGTDVSESTIQDRGRALIADPKAGGVLDTGGGDVEAALSGAATRLSATYTTASVLHFQMEPVNALAFEKDGIFEIHTGNQWQSLILPTLAKALGRPEASIVMRTYRVGGGFGRRLNGDYAVPAALAAKALGKPVKMVLTRADDARFDSFRSPSVQTLRIGLDSQGKMVAMDHAAAAGWPTQILVPGFMPKGTNGVHYDPFAIAGADHWYSVGTQQVRAIANDVANASFRPGWLRSVGPGWTNWAVESMIDEAAHAAKADPGAFRLGHLDGAGRNAGSAPTAVGGALRQAAVVRRAAALAGWGRKLPAGSGLGIATSFGQERDMPTWVACVAKVRVKSGAVAVERLTLVVDAGTIVDPDSARAQMEGAALWGLSLALHESTRFEKGQVADTNLDTYTPLRINEVPELVIEFIASDAPPVGLGEPATTVVAPAIANAIFAATGVRVRDLPIKLPKRA